MIEANQVVPVEKFEQFSDQFIGLSLLTDDYLTIKFFPDQEKHSIYFKESVTKLQKQVRIFHENKW